MKNNLVADALLGYVRINLVDDPVPKLKVGQWNPRPLDRQSIKSMVEDFQLGKCEPWLSPLTLILAKSELNQLQAFSGADQWTSGDAGSLKALKPFIPLRNVQYRIAGGNHRITAAKETLKIFGQKLVDLRAKASKLEDSRGTEATPEWSEKLSKAVAELQEEIGAVEQWSATVKTWPVKVFDDGAFFIYDYACNLTNL